MTRAAYEILSLEKIMEAPTAESLIDGWLMKDSFAAIIGRPKSFKSFIALDWALSVAHGVQWLGHNVKKGDVVYIYAEGGRGALKNRVSAWLKHHSQTIGGAGFYAIPNRVDIPNPDAQTALIAKIKEAGLSPALIVIDTLARNFGGLDENSTRDMGQFVSGCDKIREAFPGSTVLVVHHSGWSDKNRGRGNTALPGALDTQIVVNRADMKKLDATLDVTWQKDGGEVRPLNFSMMETPLNDGQKSLVPSRYWKVETISQVASFPGRGAKSAILSAVQSGEGPTREALVATLVPSKIKERKTFDNTVSGLKRAGKIEERDERLYEVQAKKAA